MIFIEGIDMLTWLCMLLAFAVYVLNKGYQKYTESPENFHLINFLRTKIVPFVMAFIASVACMLVFTDTHLKPYIMRTIAITIGYCGMSIFTTLTKTGKNLANKNLPK